MGDDNCTASIDSLCRNKDVSLHLKIGAIAAISVASCLGVIIPMVGKQVRILRTDGNFFFVTKAFAAGVILATGFCHMLPDADEALTSPCLPYHPWGAFPWQGFIPMVAALGTLVVDFLGTEYYERKYGFAAHGHGHSDATIMHHHGGADATGRITDKGLSDSFDHQSTADVNGQALRLTGEKGDDIECKQHPQDENRSENGQMHIIGMRAHAASHSHSHADGQHGTADPGTHTAGHHHEVSHGSGLDEVSLRHIVISQVLELGIVAHSVIIGLSLGVSESPCTIRPLIAALVFHQFFEGFALGGCISQAGFKRLAAGIMAFFFTFTTPLGICLGIGIASSYNDNSPTALIVEGVFDAISAGILIYMALVDLIAADFLSKRLRCDRKLQLFSYIALFSGAGAMSVIAIWA